MAEEQKEVPVAAAEEVKVRGRLMMRVSPRTTGSGGVMPAHHLLLQVGSRLFLR